MTLNNRGRFLVVVANGLVCGLLAFPFDPLRARVIWLIPLFAMMGLAFVYSRAVE